MSTSSKEDEITTIYKTSKYLGETKPINQSYMAFTFHVKDNQDKQQKVKFIREIITDQSELTSILNDIRFLFLEKFTDSERYLSDTKIENSTIFYVYVALPIKSKKRSTYSVDIFPYDIMYIRKDLNDKEIFLIQETLKRTNTIVHARKWGSIVDELPYKISVMSTRV